MPSTNTKERLQCYRYGTSEGAGSDITRISNPRRLPLYDACHAGTNDVANRLRSVERGNQMIRLTISFDYDVRVIEMDEKSYSAIENGHRVKLDG
jgi:hypothetical protein